MTTIRAPSPPRSGERLPWSLVELALPALTVVSGLQLLRLMVASVVGVFRDRLGASLPALPCSPCWWSGSGSSPPRPRGCSAAGAPCW